jgi:Zn-dependent peptidase ImmA (M78 family)
MIIALQFNKNYFLCHYLMHLVFDGSLRNAFANYFNGSLLR